jgi:hypothetical protein
MIETAERYFLGANRIPSPAPIALIRLAMRAQALLLTASSPKFGCLMAMLPSLESDVPNWAVDNIPASDLHPEGIEQETHATALYGFPLDFNVAGLREFLAAWPPIKLKLGELSRFECPEYDVIKFTVISPDLVKLHSALVDKFFGGVEPSKWEYNPHVTVAYVNKGAAKALNAPRLTGRGLTVTQLLYSLPEKQGREVINLNSSPIQASEQIGHQFHGNQWKDVEGAASRFRPSEKINFPKPFVGPSGAKLVAYEWKFKPEEYINKQGDDAVRRVSDWDEAEESSETGRGLVHHFHVELPDATTQLVSSETVPKLLGFLESGHSPKLTKSITSAVKTLAKLKMKLAVIESKLAFNKSVMDKVEELVFPRDRIAVRKAFQTSESKAQRFYLAGDESVMQVQHEPGEATQYTVDSLKGQWMAGEARKLGFLPVYESVHDLRRRAERQQKKIDQAIQNKDEALVQATARPISLRDDVNPVEAAHNAVRDAAASKMRLAVKKALAVAEAAALAKAKDEEERKRRREEAIAAILLLLLGASIIAHHTASNSLRVIAATGLDGSVGIPGAAMDERAAEAFAQGRRVLLEPFATDAVTEMETEVVAGVQAGETRAQIDRRLADIAQRTEDGRGEVVAQTEAQATYGDAQRRILQLAGYTTKIWNTQQDERVRETHVVCGEQGEVPMDLAFSNGLQFPGDPTGGAAEVINCRCWLTGGRRPEVAHV